MAGEEKLERVQVVLTALLEAELGDSLAEVEAALSRWRTGASGVLEAHGELLKHAARAEQLAERMARVGAGGAATLLRDAFDRGLIDRAELVAICGREPEDIEPSPPIDVDAIKPSPPPKRQLVESLLGDGPILVHIDSRLGGVRVPASLAGDSRLVLRFGYGLTPAIVDLSVDDDAISGTLTFGGVPDRCVVPWNAVYAVVAESTQRGMVWPDDVPATVAPDLLSPPPASASPDTKATDPGNDKPRRGGHLKLVK
ncbi:MAG TPA: ClpXP protease specificity-enhancing factor SspB [Kofleriaceae bacterium]|nr:ClpXP protease specificity-enhancing factor SspB [Kofleriaceae bacterium]